MSFKQAQHAHWILGGLGAIAFLGLGVLVIGNSVEWPSSAGVRADFIPAEHIERLAGGPEVGKSLKEMLARGEWSVLLFFRPTDCYSCVTYGQQLEDELQPHRQDSLLIAAIAVDTNTGELRSFLQSVELPYPVFVAPARLEAQPFYQALDKVGQTPLLTLAEGERVRYATRLLPDSSVMEKRYSNLLEYVSETSN